MYCCSVIIGAFVLVLDGLLSLEGWEWGYRSIFGQCLMMLTTPKANDAAAQTNETG
jgi:hypothetical protein